MLNLFGGNNKNIVVDVQEEHPLIVAFKDAKQQYQHAMNNFEHADGRYVDVAIYEFNAAQKKMEVIIKQIREEGINYDNAIDL